MTCRIQDARVCPSCNNLVTTSEICPQCGGWTEAHFEATETEGYCDDCVKLFPAESLTVLTWFDDPWRQSTGGDLVYLCRQCLKSWEDSRSA